MATKDEKLSRNALIAMVVGSMVGSGIFKLPGRFGAATGPFGRASAPAAHPRMSCPISRDAVDYSSGSAFR